MVRDPVDCRNLLVALGIDKAHAVGYSYSGAVGLQLAVDAWQCVQSLTLIEPPPVHVPSDSGPWFAEVRELVLAWLP